jgi:hypothetical protein
VVSAICVPAVLAILVWHARPLPTPAPARAAA